MNRVFAITAIVTLLAISPTSAIAQSGSRNNGASAAAYRAYQQQLAQQQQAAAARQQELEAARQRAAAEAARKADEQKQRTGIAVVELFTSQGCSSCPPADAALKQVATVAKERDLRVYCLSFHIDYWDRLGWKDPYSKPDFSTRQAAYAAKKTDNNLYTPQMIVNGTDEFLGSDRDRIHKSITTALRKRPRTSVAIQLSPNQSKPGSLSVSYNLDGNAEDVALNFAVVQSPAANKVEAGENVGRKSMHVNVVRAFRVIVPEATTGSVELDLPESFDAGTAYDVIVYAQDKESYAIVGATAESVLGTKASS